MHLPEGGNKTKSISRGLLPAKYLIEDALLNQRDLHDHGARGKELPLRRDSEPPEQAQLAPGHAHLRQGLPPNRDGAGPLPLAHGVSALRWCVDWEFAKVGWR